MKIFLAGASGAIGRQLVPLLVEAGHEVAGTTRSPEKAGLLRTLGARPVVVDVLDREGLFEVLRAERPDAVIHQLTDLSVWDYAANTRLRVEGTRNLVDAASAIGVGRLVAESYCVYAPGEGLAHEDDPLDLQASEPTRTSVEGVLALERTVAEAPEGVVLRYGMLYGPGTAYDRHGRIAEQVLRGELAPTNDMASFLHVKDSARAALLALSWPKGIVNIVDDNPAPGTKWLPLYAQALGAPPPLPVPLPPVDVPPDRRRRGVSNAKARGELGWEPLFPTWREGFVSALT